jgi:hypothetical protein
MPKRFGRLNLAASDHGHTGTGKRSGLICVYRSSAAQNALIFRRHQQPHAHSAGNPLASGSTRQPFAYTGPMGSPHRILQAACLVLLASAFASGATLAGVVKDSAGVAMLGVSVEIRSAADTPTMLHTDVDGGFRLEGLAPGQYRIRIAQQGFEAWQTDVTLGEAATPPLEIRLRLAGVKQEIQVLAASKPNTEPVYRALRDSNLAGAWVVENVVLHRDAGIVTLKSGVIGFTRAVMGRDTEAVFVGEGEFTLTPVSTIEKDYLKSVTGQDAVAEPFDRALFCFTDDTGREIRDQAKTAATDAKIADILRDFRKRLRTRVETPRSLVESLIASEGMDNIEADILGDLYNPRQPGFFSAYLHGRTHADLRFHVKPRGALNAISSPEEVAVINLDPGEAQDGIWYLSHLRSEFEKRTASSAENNRTVAARNYRIETIIAKNDHFTALTTLDFQAVTDGDRVIRFDLLPSLRVTRVGAGDMEVPFVQEDRRADGSFYVILPRPMPRGSSHQLTIEYQGDKVIHKAGGGNFSVGARESWYPNVNTFFDHASYHVVFKVPKQYTLVSIGKLDRQWTEQDLACSEWASDAPIAIAGFNYGSFKKKEVTDPQSGFVLEGYATSDVPDYLRGAEGAAALSPARLIDQSLAETENAMRIFDAWFGKSEFSRIAITQQPEFNFGQSWPSLVYLPLSAYLDSTQRYMLMGLQSRFTNFIDEVTPHEVSHQWWGHMVGWSTYHDQWLSEGFATFSAGLYLQLTEKTPDKYLRYWQAARESILDKSSFGRRANDAGPIWLGLRLSGMKNPRAYNSVVYRKGAYILHMLRQMMFDKKEGDQPFIAMMHDFVRQHLNRNASTESFEYVVNQHMSPAMDLARNHTMDWFFAEWVYGTAIPRYKFDYTVTEADGKWLLKGNLTQSEVTPAFGMLVPVYAEIDGQVVRLGSMGIAGNNTASIQASLPKKPKRVMIDYWHDVLEQ